MILGSQLWLVVLLAATTAALAVVGLSMAWSSWRGRRDRQLAVSRLRGESVSRSDISTDGILLDLIEKEGSWTESLFDLLPRSGDLRRLLDQGDLRWTRSKFLILTAAAAGLGWILGYLLLGIPVVALVPAIMGATAPTVFAMWRKRKRLEAFEQLFPEAIDLLGRAILAGHAFATGLQMVADELSEPVSFEFRRVFEEQKYGLPLEDSLYNLADRVDLVDVRIFTTAILVQREVGGNLAEILETLARTIRDRFTIQRQVRVYTAQGRFTGYLLAGLPFVAGFLIFLLNPEYMSVLWTEKMGRILMAVSLLMQFFGFLVIRRIVDIEV